MSTKRPNYKQAIQQATLARKNGDLVQARRWAAYAARLAPDQEIPWLMLGILASPRASLEYFKKALEINPQSELAREGIRRANKKLSGQQEKQGQLSPRATPVVRPETLVRRQKPAATFFYGIMTLAIFALMVWGGVTSIRSVAAAANLLPTATYPLRLAARVNPLTPTPTPTATATPTPTPTPTPTATATPRPTNTPTPTAKPTKTSRPVNYASPPAEISEDEFWLEVNLTNQQLIAHRGDKVLKTFTVSTGTWDTPTVIGQYQVYVKLEFTDMAGPGYYLPDVPYTMYFYKGYGIHGTYWHSNFGTPMSHGCVNMETSEASWVFKYAKVGTWVIIHY